MAVMDMGKFKQIGTPTEIYEFPESRFVADFIGSANIFEGKVINSKAGHVTVSTDVGELVVNYGQSVSEGKNIWIGIRPEKIHLSKTITKKLDGNHIKGVVEEIGYLGETSIYKVRLENGQIIDVSAPNQSRPMNQARGITWEDVVYLSWEPESAMLLNS